MARAFKLGDLVTFNATMGNGRTRAEDWLSYPGRDIFTVVALDRGRAGEDNYDLGSGIKEPGSAASLRSVEGSLLKALPIYKEGDVVNVGKALVGGQLVADEVTGGPWTVVDVQPGFLHYGLRKGVFGVAEAQALSRWSDAADVNVYHSRLTRARRKKVEGKKAMAKKPAASSTQKWGLTTRALGNNESVVTGIDAQAGGYMALTNSESQSFKTVGGAIRWLARRGYNADGTRMAKADRPPDPPNPYAPPPATAGSGLAGYEPEPSPIGVKQFGADSFVAYTQFASKRFKTRRGAERWLASKGYSPEGVKLAGAPAPQLGAFKAKLEESREAKRKSRAEEDKNRRTLTKLLAEGRKADPRDTRKAHYFDDAMMAANTAWTHGEGEHLLRTAERLERELAIVRKAAKDRTTSAKAADILDESPSVKAALRYSAGESVETPKYTSASDRLASMGLIEGQSGALTNQGHDAFTRLVHAEGKGPKHRVWQGESGPMRDHGAPAEAARAELLRVLASLDNKARHPTDGPAWDAFASARTLAHMLDHPGMSKKAAEAQTKKLRDAFNALSWERKPQTDARVKAAEAEREAKRRLGKARTGLKIAMGRGYGALSAIRDELTNDRDYALEETAALSRALDLAKNASLTGYAQADELATHAQVITSETKAALASQARRTPRRGGLALKRAPATTKGAPAPAPREPRASGLQLSLFAADMAILNARKRRNGGT